MKVTACVISSGRIDQAVLDAIRRQTWPVELLTSERPLQAAHPVRMVERLAGVAEHREHVRKMLLATSCDAALLVDADVIIPRVAAATLVAALGPETPVVGGLYRMAGEGRQPWCCLRVNPAGEAVQLRTRLHGLAAVNVCGLGCCLIAREVLELVPFRFRPNDFVKMPDGVLGWHDDSSRFCLDAALAGFSVWVVGGVVAEHRWWQGSRGVGSKRRAGLGVNRPTGRGALLLGGTEHVSGGGRGGR